jgi:hypothetical protein
MQQAKAYDQTNIDYQLYNAVFENEADQIRELVRQGANIEAVAHGKPMIYHAVPSTYRSVPLPPEKQFTAFRTLKELGVAIPGDLANYFAYRSQQTPLPIDAETRNLFGAAHKAGMDLSELALTEYGECLPDALQTEETTLIRNTTKALIEGFFPSNADYFNVENMRAGKDQNLATSIRQAMEAGVSPNARWRNKPLLKYAASSIPWFGAKPLCELLERGANTQFAVSFNKQEFSVLDYALIVAGVGKDTPEASVRKQRVDAVPAIVKAGANPNLHLDDMPLLFHAIPAVEEFAKKREDAFALFAALKEAGANTAVVGPNGFTCATWLGRKIEDYLLAHDSFSRRQFNENADPALVRSMLEAAQIAGIDVTSLRDRYVTFLNPAPTAAPAPQVQGTGGVPASVAPLQGDAKQIGG